MIVTNRTNPVDQHPKLVDGPTMASKQCPRSLLCRECARPARVRRRRPVVGRISSSNPRPRGCITCFAEAVCTAKDVLLTRVILLCVAVGEDVEASAPIEENERATIERSV